MKTSNFVSFVMILALGALVGCGKKDSKSKGGYRCGVNLNCSNYGTAPGQITDSTAINSKMAELQNHFNAKALTDGVSSGQETLFYTGGSSTSTNSFLGLFDYKSTSWKSGCEFTRVAVNGNGLDFARASNNCNSVPVLTSYQAYDPNSSNQHLKDALNNVASVQQIYSRLAIWSLNGSTANQSTAYTIITRRNFGTELIEYTIVPDMPTYLNPVAYRNLTTGAVRQFNYVQLQ